MFIRSQNGVSSWVTLKQALCMEFGTAASSFEVHRLLKNRRKRQNEDYLEYLYSLMEIGESFISLNYQSRLSTSFICRTIPEVCEAIYGKLKESFLQVPSNALEWELISKDFAIKWQFPNCLGALDGKHINFRVSRTQGAFYHNYKGTNSIILLALVDAHCRFLFVDVGTNGRANDAGVLQRSPLKQILENEESLPRDSAVGRRRNLPYVVVADDAFPLQRHIMKHYPYHTNNKKKQIYNLRLSRARHVVEHAFGILCNRFRVFLTTMNVKVETVEKITLACIVLHNFLLQADHNYINSYTSNSSTTLSTASDGPYNPRKGEAERIRQDFTEYFCEEGKLDWVNQKLN
ncbi:uncharacterized protein LOC118734932 [Rhagoletis pomonella]|uniref:uncharacterized protein LOC118734932 n=1 Tax=Rhagoletis pomonella TaxID=28610 RepID=UPI00177CAFEC|nr:uncharacterized protein LOC118734932 [Rhagoletis pomonella]